MSWLTHGSTCTRLAVCAVLWLPCCCECDVRLARQKSERPHAEPQVDAHRAAVVGVACDARNRVAVSVSQRGDVKRWGFKTLKLHSELPLGCEALQLCLHPHSMLAAVCCGDHVVRIVDSEQMVVVRPILPRPTAHSPLYCQVHNSTGCTSRDHPSHAIHICISELHRRYGHTHVC